MIMSKFVFLIIASIMAGTGGVSPSATAVTLWQFGHSRLLSGEVILPMQPLGTAGDGAATTYLYQAANLNTVARTNEVGLLTIETTLVPTPRTIVVAASGWVESPDNVHVISCSVINSDFGACVDSTIGSGASTANTGTPSAKVLPVSLTAPPIIPPTLTSQITPAPSVSFSALSDQHSDKTSRAPAVGAIVGGILGGVVFLVVGVMLVIFTLRRRRLRHISTSTSNVAPYPVYTAHRGEALARATIRGPTKGGQRTVRALNRNRGVDSAPPADSSQRMMGEIVGRLRKLEDEVPLRTEEPPPRYGESDV
ncbi:hypothetical protein DFH09DRAFT_1220034 [Mycena vulgaris]|nr:hypothetical protein DFH09DRAFT_1220034 [Mycena vulgaris]